MKTLKTDFQNELISYLESLKGKDGVESPAYFLEELRPKRVRRKVKETIMNGDGGTRFIENNA